MEGLALSDFQTYKTTLLKKVWCSCQVRDRSLMQNRKTKNTLAHIWKTDFQKMLQKHLSGDTVIFLTNFAGTFGYPSVRLKILKLIGRTK